MPNLYKELNREQFQDSKSFDANGNISKTNIKTEKQKSPDFQKYIDTTGELSSKDLKKFLWFTKNRVLLYRLAISGLIAFSAMAFIFSLWKLADYLIYGYQSDQQLYADLASSYDYTGANVRYAPAPLQILSTNTMESGVNKVDAVAEIYNPNDRFMVEFDYSFDFGSATNTVLHAVLMPMQTRPVVLQGLDSNLYGGGADLIISNIKWQRISRHEIDDMTKFLGEHLLFEITDVAFVPTNGTADANIINFKLTNNSAFNYRAPEFLVGLFQSGSLAQVIPLKLTDFKSLETKNIDLRSFLNGLNASEVEIYPLINLFDKESYTE